MQLVWVKQTNLAR